MTRRPRRAPETAAARSEFLGALQQAADILAGKLTPVRGETGRGGIS